MREARWNGDVVAAGPESPQLAKCPSCDGEVEKRKRKRSDGDATYFYRHKIGVGEGCPRRYSPVA